MNSCKKKSSPSMKIMTFIVAENRQPLKLQSDSANPNKNTTRIIKLFSGERTFYVVARQKRQNRGKRAWLRERASSEPAKISQIRILRLLGGYFICKGPPYLALFSLKVNKTR